MQARDFTTQLMDGVMIGNPPYGERIGDVEVVEQAIRDVGKVMKNYPTWSVYMLSSMKNFEELYGRQATKNVNYLMVLLKQIIISSGVKSLKEINE